MALGINSSDNSTMATCFSCLQAFSHTYAAVLTCVSLLVLFLKGFVVWLLHFTPITEKTDVLNYNLFFNNTLIIFTNLLIMSRIILFGQTSQYLWSFLLCLTVIGHPLFHCILCLERYLAVQHPTVFLKYRALRYRVNVLAPAWTLVIVSISVHASICRTQVDHIIRFLFFQSIFFLLIFVTNSLCCMCILKVLIRPSPGDRSTDTGTNGRIEKQNLKQCIVPRAKKKAFIVVALIQVFVAVCYLPPFILIFSPYVLVEEHFCGVSIYCVTFILFSSILVCLRYLKKNANPKRTRS